MDAKTAAWRAVEVAVVVALLALVVGQVLGQPILLSFVTSGSMEPTLQEGDGFVAIPTALAGDTEVGDVVVFEAEEIQGGGLTTHRIVEERAEGYVTRGDANPFTDQDSGEPLVREAEIVAVAWQPGGDVLVIPGLGTLVTAVQSILESIQRTLAQLLGTRALLGVQGIGYLLFGASVLLYLIAVWLDDDKRRDRSRTRDSGVSSRQLMVALSLLVVAGATAAMVIPAGVQGFSLVSADFESDAPDVIPKGTNESYQYGVGNSGIVPTVVYLESGSDNMAVEPTRLSLPGRSTANATVTITAPPETGYYESYLVERRYLSVLPLSVIDRLYTVHPWLPILVIDLLIGVPFYLLGMWLLGTGRIRSRTRGGPSRLDRLRSRWL
jgi:signal peptidase